MFTCGQSLVDGTHKSFPQNPFSALIFGIIFWDLLLLFLHKLKFEFKNEF